jgi:hypothetical protein
LTKPVNKMRGPCLSNAMATTIASRFTSGALEQVLEELFREHWQLVYRTAFSVLRNRHDAEDVLQSIFLKLFERELPADLPRNPQGYFYRAAVNASLNVVRSRKNEVVTADFHSLQAPMPDAASEIWCTSPNYAGSPCRCYKPNKLLSAYASVGGTRGYR